MYTVQCRWDGVAPILFNRRVDEQIISQLITGKSLAKKPTLEQLKELAWQRAYKANGHFVVPGSMIKGVTREGGKKVRMGKAGGCHNLIKAIFFVEEPGYAILAKELDGLRNSTIIKKDGNLQYALWPQKNLPWSIKFKARILDDNFPLEALRESMDNGGFYMGIGSGRPEFGRFEVKECKKL